MKIAIAGGGITGSAVALDCISRGWDVTIYELSDRLGGVMKDIVAGDETYINGCHYLERGTPWLENCLDGDFLSLEHFEHSYGALTDIHNGEIVSHDFAQPTFASLVPKLIVPVNTVSSVEERLSVYPAPYAEKLKAWASNFGSIEQFAAGCIDIMQLGRLQFLENQDLTIELKKTDELLDSYVGLPKSVLFPDDPIAIASLPPNGYNAFFAEIESELRSGGAEINYSTPLVPKQNKDGRLEFVASGEVISANKIIWCCNPTGLFLKAGVGRLDAPVSRMVCVVGDLLEADYRGPSYYSVFSFDSPIFRVFTYDAKSPKIVVEAFDTNLELPELQALTQQVLDKIGWQGKFQAKMLERQKRYSMHTIADLEKFREFEKLAEDHDVIPGQWHLYSRDLKISEITRALDRISA